MERRILNQRRIARRIVVLAAAAASLAAPAAAGVYRSFKIDFDAGKADLDVSGRLRVAASSTTSSTHTIVLEGEGGHLTASSGTFNLASLTAGGTTFAVQSSGVSIGTLSTGDSSTMLFVQNQDGAGATKIRADASQGQLATLWLESAGAAGQFRFSNPLGGPPTVEIVADTGTVTVTPTRTSFANSLGPAHSVDMTGQLSVGGQATVSSSGTIVGALLVSGSGGARTSGPLQVVTTATVLGQVLNVGDPATAAASTLTVKGVTAINLVSPASPASGMVIGKDFTEVRVSPDFQTLGVNALKILSTPAIAVADPSGSFIQKGDLVLGNVAGYSNQIKFQHSYAPESGACGIGYNESTREIEIGFNCTGGADPARVRIASATLGHPSAGLEVETTGNVTGRGAFTMDAASLTVRGASLLAETIDLSTGLAAPAPREGRLYWDSTDQTLTIQNDVFSTALQVGQEVWIRGFNETGATIFNGDVVYINSASGGLPSFDLAIATDEAKARTVGIATHDIEDGTTGYVTAQGTVRGIDTSSFQPGELVLLSSSVPGGFQSALPPSPNFAIQVGLITFVDPSSGTILVDLASRRLVGEGQAQQVKTMDDAGAQEIFRDFNDTPGRLEITKNPGSFDFDVGNDVGLRSATQTWSGSNTFSANETVFLSSITAGIYQQEGGDVGIFETCSAGQSLGGLVVSGGIVTSGSCIAAAGGDAILSDTQTFSGANTFTSSLTVRSHGRDIILSTSGILGVNSLEIDGVSGAITAISSITASSVTANLDGSRGLIRSTGAFVGNTQSIASTSNVGVATATITLRGGVSRNVYGMATVELTNSSGGSRTYTISVRRGATRVSAEWQVSASNGEDKLATIQWQEHGSVAGTHNYSVTVRSTSTNATQQARRAQISLREF